MEKIESSVKHIASPLELVYEKMSDLNNLSAFRAYLNDPEKRARLMERIGDQAPKDKVDQAFAIFEKMQLTADTITLETSLGQIVLRITERELNKTLKFETESSPLPFQFWIQLLPVDSASCKMKLTIKLELNFFMRKMVEKPLKQGIEGLASVLALIPYGK